MAMSPLQLPPYVLEHVFNCIDWRYQPRTEPYNERIATKRIAVAGLPQLNTNENFIHLLIEERSHSENIKLFIAIHRAYKGIKNM